MIKIRFNGRGGQGAKTSAQLLAVACLSQGKYIQAFPEYGPERRGAPVKAFVKIDNKPIVSREPINNPNIVVVIDASLLEIKDTYSGLDKHGILLINTSKTKKQITENLIKNNLAGKIYTINASKISLDLLGINMPNMPMLGALIKITKIIQINSLVDVIKKHFEKKIGKEKTQLNIEAIKRAYNEIL